MAREIIQPVRILDSDKASQSARLYVDGDQVGVNVGEELENDDWEVNLDAYKALTGVRPSDSNSLIGNTFRS
ncbi:MAG: hypothetical protein ABI758_01050 [Candidatus Woesebacteria bacterium]